MGRRGSHGDTQPPSNASGLEYKKVLTGHVRPPRTTGPRINTNKTNKKDEINTRTGQGSPSLGRPSAFVLILLPFV